MENADIFEHHVAVGQRHGGAVLRGQRTPRAAQRGHLCVAGAQPAFVAPLFRHQLLAAFDVFATLQLRQP